MFSKCPCVRDTILRVALLNNLRYLRNLRRFLGHFKGDFGLLNIFSFSSCLRDGQVLHGNLSSGITTTATPNAMSQKKPFSL